MGKIQEENGLKDEKLEESMKLLGRGHWYFGISKNAKWKIIPLILAAIYLIATIYMAFTHKPTDILPGIATFIIVVAILRMS